MADSYDHEPRKIVRTTGDATTIHWVSCDYQTADGGESAGSLRGAVAGASKKIRAAQLRGRYAYGARQILVKIEPLDAG